MITREDCFKVGEVAKTHNLQGEVVITTDSDLLERYAEQHRDPFPGGWTVFQQAHRRRFQLDPLGECSVRACGGLRAHALQRQRG